ncbi:MAG: SDR family NAD(P)-dependent oxidoreductase [Acidimicrobiales bacterium]
MELSGKRVLITGASRGIGAALAQACADAGAKVALAARSGEAITALAERLGGQAYPIDLSDQSQVDGFIARVEADGGPVDVLVNNAAVDTNQLIDEIDEAEIGRCISLNLITPQRLVRQVLPGMLQRGAGHLVHVSSMASIVNVPGTSVYSSTKAGLSHFSGGLRADLKGTPIGLTLVEPGPVDTEMWDHVNMGSAVAAAGRRFERLRQMPHSSPETLAAMVVKAVQSDRYHVRLPKRGLGLFVLEDLPRRALAACLVGINPRR